MIVPARFIDVPAMVGLLVEQHPKSCYAPYGEVNQDYARKLLANAVQKHGGIHNGAMCAFVSREGEAIDGFMVGALSPVYHVGTKLWAQDVYLVVRDGAPVITASRLIDAYVGWAISSPKVIEIHLSRIDALPTSARADKLYIRKRFEPFGRIFRMSVGAMEQVGQAA